MMGNLDKIVEDKNLLNSVLYSFKIMGEKLMINILLILIQYFQSINLIKSLQHHIFYLGENVL